MYQKKPRLDCILENTGVTCEHCGADKWRIEDHGVNSSVYCVNKISSGTCCYTLPRKIALQIIHIRKNNAVEKV